MSMRALALIALSTAALLAQKSETPTPPAKDQPYLIHAGKLVPLDKDVAKEDKRKDGTAYITPGTAAKARTPLAEPAFTILTDKIQADKLQLFRLEVKGGNREVTIYENRRKQKDVARPLRLSVSHAGPNLYRLEAGETLEPGQYALTPDGSNDVFSFEVF